MEVLASMGCAHFDRQLPSATIVFVSFAAFAALRRISPDGLVRCRCRPSAEH
jgi:hypothetical protein